MTTKFLSPTSSGDLTNGSVNVLGATLSATNLNASSALKTNSSKIIISTNLEISDTNGLAAALALVVNNWNRTGTLLHPVTVGDSVGCDTFQSEAGVVDVVFTNTLDAQDNIKTDVINESTGAVGVTIEGVILKDNTIEASSAIFPVLKFIRSGTLTTGSLETLTGVNSALQGCSLSSAAIGEGFGGGTVFCAEGSNQAETGIGREYFRLTSAGTTSGEWQVWGGALGNTLMKRIATTDHRSYVAGTEVMNLTSTGLNIDTIKEFTTDNGVDLESVHLEDSVISNVTSITTEVIDVNLPADDNIIVDALTNPRTITEGVLRINHQPAINSTRSIHCEMTNDGKDDTRAMTVNYDLSGNSTNASVNGWFMTSDVTGTTNHHINYLTCEKTGSIGANMDLHALHCESGIDVIDQSSGSLIAIEKAWIWATGFTDATAAFNSTGTDLQMFVNDNDYIAFGKATVFNEIDFTLAIVASGAGIDPLFEYSDGVGTFATLVASDSTNGMRNNGVLSWDQPSGWISADLNGSDLYWIKITRQRNTLPTPPTEDIIKYETSNNYKWSALGDLIINDITCASADITGTLTVDTITESSSGNGVMIEGAKIENSQISCGTTASPLTGCFFISGTNANNQSGSHFYTINDGDTRALMYFRNYSHDDMNIFFDCFSTSGGIIQSSDIGSNYAISKNADLFKIQYDSGITQGSPVTLKDGLVLTTGGSLSIPTNLNIGSSATSQFGVATIVGQGSVSTRPSLTLFNSGDIVYPTFQIKSSNHDSTFLFMDSYWDASGVLRSADAGSNMWIGKTGGQLVFRYDTGIAQGTEITTPSDFMIMDATTGNVAVGGDFTQSVHTDDVSNPPTDAELDGIFGTPATVGTGFSAYIDDNGAGANFFKVVSDGTNWWIETLTKAT